MQVDEFNALPADDARTLVAGWLGVRRWVDDVVAGRPYSDVAALHKRAHDSALVLTDHELASALSRHPRIGQSRDADDAESRHSRREQAGVDARDAERLRAANTAYEQRFGHLFLVRAAGRTTAEIVVELQRRLVNDEETEREETVAALREIALLRLEQAVE